MQANRPQDIKTEDHTISTRQRYRANIPTELRLPTLPAQVDRTAQRKSRTLLLAEGDRILDTPIRTMGYEKNPYGDFPDDASNASEPRYDDQGYDRKDKFPPGSAMDVQYNTYKAVDNTAGVSNSAYRNARNKLAAPKQSSWDGQAYGVSAGKFHYPEDHETLYAMASTAANDARM
ncbi:hypothetical protein MMC34_007527 [Xylographa carneopallida]|nr:hypothetical protein [Xylographa carneopallida]